MLVTDFNCCKIIFCYKSIQRFFGDFSCILTAYIIVKCILIIGKFSDVSKISVFILFPFLLEELALFIFSYNKWGGDVSANC